MKIILVAFLAIVLLSSLSASAAPVALAESTTDSSHDSNMPPMAILESNGTSQDARVGSYCWANETVEACEDSVGIPTALMPIVATSPVSARLRIATKQLPDELSASVFVALKADEFEVETGDHHIWSYKEDTLVTLQPKFSQEITLELDPRLYVFNVFCVWKNKGEVSYGFFIDVE